MKGKFNIVDDAEEGYGLSVESYLCEAAGNVEPQPDSIPDLVLASVDHLGQSQLEVVMAKAFHKITDHNLFSSLVYYQQSLAFFPNGDNSN